MLGGPRPQVTAIPSYSITVGTMQRSVVGCARGAAGPGRRSRSPLSPEGFITMTPQLFINYKLKSVAHLPWRMLTYKALNTFIDDLFAFVIKMPVMYRIGCLRDGKAQRARGQVGGRSRATLCWAISASHGPFPQMWFSSSTSTNGGSTASTPRV